MFMYNMIIQIYVLIDISIFTESIYYTYFTTNTQIIRRKCYKSTAPYISNY